MSQEDGNRHASEMEESLHFCRHGEFKIFELAFLQLERYYSKARNYSSTSAPFSSMLEGKDLRSYFHQFLSFLNINNQLKIQPRALAQLDNTQIDEILKITSELQNGKTDIKKLEDIKRVEYRYINSILKDYEIQFDEHFINMEIFIARIFGVQFLKEVKINDKNIFANIRPFEIKRLYDLFKNNQRMEKYIEPMKRFAEKVKVENVADFCATADYIYRILSEEVSSNRKGNTKSAVTQSEDEIKSKFYANIDEYQKSFDDIVNKFSNLMIMGTNELKFSSSRTAATHYYKHAKEALEPEIATPELYLKKARTMMDNVKPKSSWTQDGTSIKHKYYENDFILIIIEDIFTGHTIIATYFKIVNKRRR